MRNPARPLLLAALASGALACSDPMPVIPEGGFAVTVSAAGQRCNLASHSVSLGTVGSTGSPSLVASDVGTTVSCAVWPLEGGGFGVQGKAVQADRGLQLYIASLPTTATRESPALGRAVYASVSTAGQPYTSPDEVPCRFYFEPGTTEGVSSGRVHLGFDCPEVSSGLWTCGIRQGYAAFQRCSETR